MATMAYLLRTVQKLEAQPLYGSRRFSHFFYPLFTPPQVIWLLPNSIKFIGIRYSKPILQNITKSLYEYDCIVQKKDVTKFLRKREKKSGEMYARAYTQDII